MSQRSSDPAAERRAGSASATTQTSASVRAVDGLVEYQVLTVNVVGDESFLSEPLRVVAPGMEQTVTPDQSALEHVEHGYTGGGYLRLTRDASTVVTIPVSVARDGVYAIDVRYANGNGPVNTEDKVAVRTLLVDGDTTGVLVMPQRGAGRWSEWGWSNALQLRLKSGQHALRIVYTPLDRNMNGRENTALLDAIRLTLLGH